MALPKSKASWLLAIPVILVGGTLAFINYSPDVTVLDHSSNNDQQKVQTDTHIPLDFSKLSDEESFISGMVAELKARHGHEISELTVQLMLQDFRDFVLERFPSNGFEIFEQIIALAFPKHIDDILSIIAKMDTYNAWFSDNLLNLNDMNELSRRGAIWNKRRELFGDLAEIIWQEERNKEESKRLAVQEAVDALHKADEMGMQERLYVLQNTIQEQYGDGNTNFLINKGMVANMYFHLDSVQKDLHAMSSDDRAIAIAESRRQLGFTEEDIEYMAKQDAKKESRWKNGYEYMSEKDQLTASYSGDELESKLDDLREKYFGREAPTIKKEEASGFNRYERPRLYGRN